jgi:hypothetical protein
MASLAGAALAFIPFTSLTKAPLSVTHPKVAAEWHPTKNAGMSHSTKGKVPADLKGKALTPGNITAGSGLRVWWVCQGDPNHKHPVRGGDFSWEAVVWSRAKGSGCPGCAGHKRKRISSVTAGLNDLATTHPEVASQWHPSKNDTMVDRKGVSAVTVNDKLDPASTPSSALKSKQAGLFYMPLVSADGRVRNSFGTMDSMLSQSAGHKRRKQTTPQAM